MRLIVLIITFILVSNSLYAQNYSIHDIIPENDIIKTSSVFDYKNSKDWKTYKILNIAGWSSLGLGLPTTFYGIIGLGLSLNDGGNGHPFIAIIATGGALTLSSIPLLIMANKYKKKARMSTLCIGLTNIETPSYTGSNISTPAINLTFNF